MSYTTQKLKDVSVIRTGKLDSNAAVENGIYPFFTCDPQTLKINTWAYDTEAVLLAGNNASGNYTAKYYRGKFNAYQRTYIIETADSEVLSVRFLCYAINQQLRLLKTMSSGSTTNYRCMTCCFGRILLRRRSKRSRKWRLRFYRKSKPKSPSWITGQTSRKPEPRWTI